MFRNIIIIFGNNSKIKKIFFFILLLLLFIFYKNLSFTNINYNKQLLLNLNETEFKYIAHAGGGINGIKYTNSLEAIKNSINNGFKLIEIDLMETTDGHFVGVHDWSSFKKFTNYKNMDHNSMPYEDFKNLKIHQKFIPIDVIEINKIFSKNQDIYLVTDKNNNFDKIYEDFKFNKDRIIIEIFGKKNFKEAIQKKIFNPMFSMNYSDYDFVVKNNIKLVSAHTGDIINNKKIYKSLVERGVYIFAYSSNEKYFIENNINKYFTNIYTDFWDIKNQTCFEENCTTY